MNRQKLTRLMCLTVAAGLLVFPSAAVGEQDLLAALPDDGTTIETMAPSQENDSDAKAILHRDGQKAVAVFARVGGKWVLEAQSPWFTGENEGRISLSRINSTVFMVELGAPDMDSQQVYTFEKTDEGWEAVAFDGTNLHWQQREDGEDFRVSTDSVAECFPIYWNVMLTDINFSKMPQTMEEMHALLLADDIARITLPQYATVPLREAPTEDAHYSYVLNDGAMLTVLDRRDGWAQLSLNDQLTGWVPENILEIGNQGYRYHNNSEMCALSGSLTILKGPSATAQVLRELTDRPIENVIGWCGGAFSDVSDGVWAIVLVQNELGYIRLNELSYGNG